MAKPEKNVPELVRAAEVLENEIASLEALSKATRKIPLNSERNITRAAKELTETAQFQERLAAGLQALSHAMAQLQAPSTSRAGAAGHVRERDASAHAAPERAHAHLRFAGQRRG